MLVVVLNEFPVCGMGTRFVLISFLVINSFLESVSEIDSNRLKRGRYVMIAKNIPVSMIHFLPTLSLHLPNTTKNGVPKRIAQMRIVLDCSKSILHTFSINDCA